MKRILILTLVIMMAIVSTGYCINLNNWGQTDLDPLLKRELPHDLIYLGHSRSGVSTMTSGSLAIPLGYSVVKKEIGSAMPLTLANGIPGQSLRFVISADAESFTARLTPTTCTGFTSIDFNAVGDQVVLVYIDDTSGWMLDYDNSVTINQ